MHRIVPLLLVAVVAACGASTTTTVPSAADELAAAAATLGSTASYRVVITREGPPLSLDVLPGAAVVAVSGVFVSPDQAEGLAEVRLGPLPGSLAFVAIGDTVWLSNPFGGWEEVAAADSLDLPSLLGPDGLPRFVAEDTTQVVVEDVEGVVGYRATFDTTRLSEVSGGVVGRGVTALRGVVGPDGMLASLVFADPQTPGLTWRFEFTEPGAGDGLVIEPPA